MGGRSAWKGPFFSAQLHQAIKQAAGKPVTTDARNSVIIPAMVGARLLVHNGKDHVPLTVREEMVGKYLGAFVGTKKTFSYRATNAHKKNK